MFVRTSLMSVLFFALAVSSFSLDSAEAQNYQQLGTRRGAVAGAVVGGLIGGNNDHTALGIITGGVVGGVVGNQIGQRQDQRSYQQNYGYQNYSQPNYAIQGRQGHQNFHSTPPYVAPQHNQHLHQQRPTYQAPVQYSYQQAYPHQQAQPYQQSFPQYQAPQPQYYPSHRQHGW